MKHIIGIIYIWVGYQVEYNHLSLKYRPLDTLIIAKECGALSVSPALAECFVGYFSCNPGSSFRRSLQRIVR